MQHAIKCPTYFSSRVAAGLLDSVDNLRLGDARPPLVPQALFEGSAVLVRIARLQFLKNSLNCSPLIVVALANSEYDLAIKSGKPYVGRAFHR